MKKPLQNNVYTIAFHRCHNCVEVMSWPVILCRDMTTGCTAHQSPRQLRIVHICAAPSPGPTSAQRHPALEMEDRRWRRWKTEDGEDGRQHNTMTFIFQSPATSTSRPPRQPGRSKWIQIQIKNKLNERHKHYLMPSLQILS